MNRATQLNDNGLRVMNFSGIGRRRGKGGAVEPTLAIDGRELAIELRRNARARRLILRLDKTATAVRVTVPEGCDEAEALRFAHQHASWIRARLLERPAAVSFTDGETIPVRGEPHVIVHRPGARGSVWLEDGCGGPPRLCVAGDAAHLPRRLTDWLKREARRELRARCDHHATRMGLSYKRVDLRDQTSRWGSCSSSGVLSFSWRLILAPLHVLDYVAAHEVAHLREMNHSRRFWTLVEEALPTMRRSRKWLRDNGAALHLYGAGKAP